MLRRHKSFAVLLATIVLMELAHGVEIVTLLPLYLTQHFGESGAFVGLVTSTYLLVDTLLTRTPAGIAADRWGRKRVLALGILLSLVPIPFMVFANAPWLFIPLSVVNGLGAGMIWPAIYALVADLYGSERRGTVLGLINVVMLGGLAAGGPISGSLILSLLGYPAASAYSRGFAVCILFVLLALILVLAFVHERGEHAAHLAPHASADMDQKGTRLDATLGLLLVIGLLITLGLGLIVPILTLFGTQVLKVSLGEFALILTPPALVAAAALLPAGRWADRRGRHTPMLLGLGLIAVPFWGAAVSTDPFVVSAGGMVAALGYALLAPAWNALVMDWVPVERRGAWLGAVATVQGLGLAAGPAVGGRLYELNPYAPFWTGGALLTLGFVLAAIISLRSPQRVTRAHAQDITQAE